MKKIFASLFFISLICGFAFAQNSFPELEIAKEIKLLISTRADVKIIMSEFDRDEEDDEEETEGVSNALIDDEEEEEAASPKPIVV